MEWTTKLLEEYENGKLSFERDCLVDSILNGSSGFESPYYKDIKGLRKANLDFKITDDERINMSDSSNIYNIFNLYDHQIEMIKLIKSYKYLILHTSRQIGSTTAMIYSIFKDMMIDMSFNTKFHIIFSDSSQFVNNIKIKFISLYSDEFPFYMKPGVVDLNFKSITFDNKHVVRFVSSVEELDEYKHELADFYFLDFAFNSDTTNEFIINDFFPKMRMMSHFYRIIIQSCGTDSSKHFIDIIKDDKFKRYVFDYKVIPRIDNFEEEIIKMIGEKSFLLEYECLLPGDKKYDRSIKLSKLID